MSKIQLARPVHKKALTSKTTLTVTGVSPPDATTATGGAKDGSESTRIVIPPARGNTGVQDALRKLNSSLASPDITDDQKIQCAACLAVNLSKIVNDNLLTIKIDQSKFQDAWKDDKHATSVKAAVAASLLDLNVQVTGISKDMPLSAEQKAPVIEYTGKGLSVVLGAAE